MSPTGKAFQAAVARIVDESGSLYGLVNNAGIGLRGFFEDLADSEIRRMFDVNFFGVLAVTKEVLPHMRTNGRKAELSSSVRRVVGSLL